jgi:hypothetical protein
MIRHASAEDLAGLDLDALRPRKAAKVRRHVSGCDPCTQLSSQVSAVPALLASVPYPPMPPSVATQLDTALRSESTRRLASAPATEAGRRDLPERRAGKPRVAWQWQLPGMSVVATRLVAAAGALIILGVGGYVITSNTGSNLGGTAASSSGAAAPGTQHVSFGPTVEYGQPSATKTIRTVQSTTNFTAANLGAEAEAAVQAAKSEGAVGARPAGPAVPGSTMGANSPSSPTHSQALAPASLTRCLDAIVGSQPVQLVDSAKFEGQPATIIVTQQTAQRPAEVWVVGPACSASNHDVLAHQTLSGI